MTEEAEDMGSPLDLIVHYNMTEREAKAYKVCLIWTGLCERLLPDYKFSRLPGAGDPRKCHLFHAAWKMVRETAGILPDAETGLYVRAQIEILKGIKRAGGSHVDVDPLSLSGKRAWRRWQLYRRWFEDRRLVMGQTRAESGKTSLFKVAQEVGKTREFFSRFYGDGPSPEEVVEMVRSGNLRRWVALGKVSPYWVLMSPLCRDAFQDRNFAEYFGNVDLALYAPDLTSETRKVFMEKFPGEFPR